jgi:hypothetical protein
MIAKEKYEVKIAELLFNRDNDEEDLQREGRGYST